MTVWRTAAIGDGTMAAVRFRLPWFWLVVVLAAGVLTVVTPTSACDPSGESDRILQS